MIGVIKLTTVVSFINLKGGVGKTSLSVNLAAILAKIYDFNVLFVDLDPQTNGTVSLITQEEWNNRDQYEKQTLFHLFNDLITGNDNFDINKAILKGVSDIKNLDLLPSSLGLVKIQDDIPDIDRKAYVNHVDVLGNTLDSILKSNEYDYVFIDCPPNLGSITLNGISISDYYVIPTIPDILSTIGIDLIQNRIEYFKTKKKTCDIELGGIIFTKVDYRTNLHNATMERLRYEYDDLVFKSDFPQRISISEAPADNKPFIVSPRARAKSDYKETKKILKKITKEFIEMIKE